MELIDENQQLNDIKNQSILALKRLFRRYQSIDDMILPTRSEANNEYPQVPMKQETIEETEEESNHECDAYDPPASACLTPQQADFSRPSSYPECRIKQEYLDDPEHSEEAKGPEPFLEDTLRLNFAQHQQREKLYVTRIFHCHCIVSLFFFFSSVLELVIAKKKLAGHVQTLVGLQEIPMSHNQAKLLEFKRRSIHQYLTNEEHAQTDLMERLETFQSMIVDLEIFLANFQLVGKLKKKRSYTKMKRVQFPSKCRSNSKFR